MTTALDNCHRASSPWQIWLCWDSEGGFDQWSPHQHGTALRSTKFPPVPCRWLQPITGSCRVITVSKWFCASYSQGPVGIQGPDSIHAEHASQPRDTDKGLSLSACPADKLHSSIWLSTRSLSCCGRHGGALSHLVQALSTHCCLCLCLCPLCPPVLALWWAAGPLQHCPGWYPCLPVLLLTKGGHKGILVT